MRSDNVKTGMQQAPHRSLFNALGFTEEEMTEFRKYILSIDGPKYEAINRDIPNRRKIFLRTPIHGFYCTLSTPELKELQQLVHKTLKLPDVYNLFMYCNHDTCLN